MPWTVVIDAFAVRACMHAWAVWIVSLDTCLTMTPVALLHPLAPLPTDIQTSHIAGGAMFAVAGVLIAVGVAIKARRDRRTAGYTQVDGNVAPRTEVAARWTRRAG